MMRFWLAASLSFLLCGCTQSEPGQAAVQTAVIQAVDQFKVAGNVTVVGMHPVDQNASAQVDLRFDGFQYKVTTTGTLLVKTYQPPPEPDIHSPNFYQQMAQFSTQGMIQVKNYSGPGTASLTRYNDGRWVLTTVTFAFFSLSPNSPVQ